MSHITPMFPNQLEPELDQALAALCLDLPPERIAELIQQIAAHVTLVQQALQYNEFLDVSIARRIAGVLSGLLQEYADFSPPHQRLIVGAARYFVHSQDVQADLGSLLGFDDDVAVLNFVLVKIGRGELRIEL